MRASHSSLPEAVRTLKKNIPAVMGLLILALLVLVAVFAAFFSPHDPLELNLWERLAPPSLVHPMGTDSVGRDVLSRIVYGTRISLLLAAVVVLLETVLGFIVGAAAGYFGRVVDEVLMRLVDILLAFPGIILSLAVVGILGPSLMNLIIALASVGWVRYARVFRGEILAVKQEAFIESARAIGCSKVRIIIRHILPNIISPVVILATMNMGSIIVSIAGLSFLGLGVQPPTPEWGVMLSDGKPFMENAPYLMIFPGLMILVTVMAFNLLGDGLRDFLDKRVMDAVRY